LFNIITDETDICPNKGVGINSKGAGEDRVGWKSTTCSKTLTAIGLHLDGRKRGSSQMKGVKVGRRKKGGRKKVWNSQEAGGRL